jgi:hypothetical protein
VAKISLDYARGANSPNMLFHLRNAGELSVPRARETGQPRSGIANG